MREDGLPVPRGDAHRGLQLGDSTGAGMPYEKWKLAPAPQGVEGNGSLKGKKRPWMGSRGREGPQPDLLGSFVFVLVLKDSKRALLS